MGQEIVLVSRAVNTGAEWLVDASGAEVTLLRDAVRLRALMDALVTELDLRVLGESQWHTFPGPGGVTALYMLSESHLSLHTFPEHQYFALNLYHCGARGESLQPDWRALLQARTGAHTIRVQCIPRTP